MTCKGAQRACIVSSIQRRSNSHTACAQEQIRLQQPHLDALACKMLVRILRDVPVKSSQDVVLCLDQLDMDVILS
jgi:hypothetical protein